ncbi:MAG: SCO family protein [Burkholderiaceae bacterium]
MLLHVPFEPVRAHEAAPGAGQTESAAALTVPKARSRWGANYFPNVTLTTHEGKTVRLYDDLLKGKSVALTVMYTSCVDACPLETANLVQLQRLLGDRVGKDIFFYSVSIDPEHDTPEALKAYAEKFGVGPGWLFLTGKTQDISLVVKKLGLTRSADLSARDGHSPFLVVGNEPTGQWTKNSAVDNPRFLAARMGTFFGWRDTQPTTSYADAGPIVFEKGQYLFQRQCSLCHTLGLGDQGKGPDLLDITARRERAWLMRYILAPDQMLASGDPIATALFNKYGTVRMPNLSLASNDVADVLAYLEAQSGSPARAKAGKASASAR